MFGHMSFWNSWPQRDLWFSWWSQSKSVHNDVCWMLVRSLFFPSPTQSSILPSYLQITSVSPPPKANIPIFVPKKPMAINQVLEVLKSSRFNDMETVQQALEWMLTVQPLQAPGLGGWKGDAVGTTGGFHGFWWSFYRKIAILTFKLLNLSGNHH